MNAKVTVDYGELQPADDHLTLTYQGRDFTGTAIEKDRDGFLIAEVEFRDGKKSGRSREWFSSGKLRTEEMYVFDVLHGESREWYESGALKAESTHELGICLRKVEHSTDGMVTSEILLASDSPQYQTLLLLRASAIGRRVLGPS
jgi:antitoxin component YwqK of YwqJK toxin-antitoxin module